MHEVQAENQPRSGNTLWGYAHWTAIRPIAMILTFATIATLACSLPIKVVAQEPASEAESAELFTTQVKPILETHCFGCHGGDKIRGEFVMTNHEDILHVVSITTHSHDRHKSIGEKETKKRHGISYSLVAEARHIHPPKKLKKWNRESFFSRLATETDYVHRMPSRKRSQTNVPIR